jgi:hypothetical protein
MNLLFLVASWFFYQVIKPGYEGQRLIKKIFILKNIILIKIKFLIRFFLVLGVNSGFNGSQVNYLIFKKIKKNTWTNLDSALTGTRVNLCPGFIIILSSMN